MIKIQCFSRDSELLERVIALYGADKVTALGASEAFPKDLKRDGFVTILDFKYTLLNIEDSIDSPLVVLTAVPVFEEAFNLLQLGVRGYGNRQMRQSNLKQVIDNVAGGQMWLPPDVISRLITVVGQGDGEENKAESRGNVLNRLSKREREVALYVAEGMSNQEVADMLYVSLRTIKAHLSSIYDKTGIRNRLELGLALS